MTINADSPHDVQMAYLAGQLAHHDYVRRRLAAASVPSWRVPNARPAKGILLGFLLGSLVFAALGACLWALFG
jgi:hypothetical protein